MKMKKQKGYRKHFFACLLCGVFMWAGVGMQPLMADEVAKDELYEIAKPMYEKAWELRRDAGDDAAQREATVQAFRVAAEAGFPLAQRELAWCYMQGWGVEKNTEVGLRWLRQAAEQGCEQSQYELGMRYVYGHDVAKNEAEARYWLQRAAKKGYPRAQRVLQALDKKKKK